MNLIGSRVGDVKILEVLGEGGMGTVYAGFDERLEREVAVKSVRTDRLDARARARLLREARMLSRLDHRHVCRLYGYIEGEHSDYLVLERLRGVTLKDALDTGRLFDGQTRLRLAEEIADTLRVAHARGIVHRDLSPANVMLIGDAEFPSVKVLDFGLAKPVGAGPLAHYDDSSDTLAPSDSQNSVLSELGRITGTPGALSPEQARGEALTTASDMYSFGLLTQFLLTGESALEPGLGVQQKVAKALKAETRPVRGLDAETTRLIDSLLVLEPEQRPNAARTVETLHWIRERPRRLAQRLAIAAVLLVMLAGTAKYFFDLRSERNLALAAQEEAVLARGRAEQARAEAEKVSEFLVSVFGASTPGSVDPDQITARQILDSGAERIDEELAAQPLIQARLHDAIGRVYLGLGLYQGAQELQEKALIARRKLLAPGHPDLATSLLRNAEVAIRQGRFDDAHAFSREAVGLVEGQSDIPFDVRSGIVSAFGLLSMQRGELEPAEKIFKDFLAPTEAEKGPRSLPVSHILNNLAVVHLQRGEFVDAEPLLERVVSIRIEQLGDDHVSVARASGNLASAAAQNRGPKAAEDQHRRVLETLERIQGAAHPDVAQACESLGSLLLAQGRLRDARDLFERSLQIRRNALGPEHPAVAQSLHNLGEWALLSQNNSQAQIWLEEASAIQLEKLGKEHPLFLGTELLIALAYRDKGNFEAAEPILQAVLASRIASMEGQDPALGQARRELAKHYSLTARNAQALTLLDAAVAAGRDQIQERMMRPAVLDLAASLWQRSTVHQEMAAVEAAEADRRELVQMLEKIARDDDVETIEPLARSLLALGREQQARPWLDALERLEFPIQPLAPELASLLAKS